MTTVSSRIEGHAEFSSPERFVHSREVEIHASERLNCVVIGFDSQVSHLAQPEIHPLSSPVSIFKEENTVSLDESTKCSIIGRHITIIHQILHYHLSHIHSLHLSSPTSNQQCVCHGCWTHSSASLHLLEQVHRTIHVLRLDPSLHECGVSVNVRS